MKQRKLIVLSGGGDPENEKYAKVYEVIRAFAQTLDYGDVIVQGWKGQFSFPENGFINMKEATEAAKELFERVEKTEEGYDVICRSFGTGVFLNVCQGLDLKRIGFASLWGMPSYTAFYELFKEGIATQSHQAKGKGLNIDETFFDSVVPFELLLTRFTQGFRVNFVSGSDDCFCTPVFSRFLQEMVKEKSNVRFSVVADLPHEVPSYHGEYLARLFSIA